MSGVGRREACVVFVVAVGTVMVGLASGQQAGGFWSRLTLEELVEKSELIVIGELVAVRAPEGPRTDVGTDVGIVRVEEVIYAKVESATPVREVSLAIPSSRGILSSDMIFYRTGQRGVWFLREAPGTGGEMYLADHPQRLQADTEAATVRSIVRARAQ